MMAGLPLQPRRPRLPVPPRGLASLLYGRALSLPPLAPAERGRPVQSALAHRLRPFQQRLYLQRGAVTIVRALALAFLGMAVTLLLRAGGVALPLPVTPLVVAGALLLAGLVGTLWQRPALQQVAHALDRRLGLRDQISSALDPSCEEGRLAARLRERAGASLSATNPSYILPWPSLRGEFVALIAVASFAGIGALLAAHAPLARVTPAAVAAAGTHHRAAPNRSTLPDILPIKLLSGVAASHTVSSSYGRPADKSTHRTGSGRGAGRAGAQFLASGLPQSHGPGKGDRSAAIASGGHPNAAHPAGRGAGHGSALRLTSGQNSTSGGVANPQQRALQSLQNVILSTQRAQQRQGQSGGSNARNGGKNGQSSSGSGQQKGSGRNGQGGNRSGTRAGQHRDGQGGTGTAHRSAQPSSSGRATGAPGLAPDARGANGNPFNRLNGGGDNGGSGSGGAQRSATGSGTAGQAHLGTTPITLSGATGKGSGLTVSVGATNRAPGLLGDALNSSSGGAVLSVPGYVAPDSNAITPDDRTVVRGYFTPSS